MRNVGRSLGFALSEVDHVRQDILDELAESVAEVERSRRWSGAAIRVVSRPRFDDKPRYNPTRRKAV